MATRAQAERHIGDLAELYGWLHHHGRSPGLTRSGCPDGFPIDTLAGGDRLVFLFLARELAANQAAWLSALRRVVSVEAHVCRPDELQTITRLLRREGT